MDISKSQTLDLPRSWKTGNLSMNLLLNFYIHACTVKAHCLKLGEPRYKNFQNIRGFEIYMLQYNQKWC